jgi:hypothetical protein
MTKNPLGVIGLFLGLIYGAAVVVAGFSEHLSNEQRWVLVGFVGAFPFTLLATFYRLVTKHHSKLYAPSDWRDERNVFGPQPPELKRAREEAEVQAIELLSDTADSESNVSVAARSERRPATSGSELLSLIREAEELAFRHLEAEFKQSIKRDVLLPGAVAEVAFDGLILGAGGKILGVEVKLLRGTKNLYNIVNQVLSSAAIAVPNVARLGSSMPFGLVLVLVTQGLSEEERASTKAKVLRRTIHVQIPLVVEVLDLDELRHEYGSTPAET